MFAAIGWGASDFVAALVAKRIGVLRTAFGVHFVSVALITIYLLSAGGLGAVSPAQWLALAGISVLSFLTYLSFYRALQMGPIAIVSPIVGAYAIIVILLAVLVFGERLGGVQLIGVSAAIAGVVLVSLDLRALRSGERLIGMGVVFGLLTMAGLGLWQYSAGVLSKEMGWFLPIYVNRVLTFAMLVPASLLWRRLPWQRLTLPLIAGLVFVAVAETGGLFAFSRGAEVGIISIVAASSTIYPVLPILGGLLVFQERIAPNQWVGLAVAMCGLLMLAASA